MKKILCITMLLILCMGVLSGCGKKIDADTSTVFIEKKGRIISIDVEDLDKEYYDASELEDYITTHVETYTAENGETVEKASFDVEEGIAKLRMEYDSYEDYTGFNGIELFTGTVVTARAAGYDFDTEFYSVVKKDGEIEQKQTTKEDVLANDDNRVVIIKANVDVCVPGEVLYVSAQDTKVTEKDLVSITGEGASEEASLTYIIYQ